MANKRSNGRNSPSRGRRVELRKLSAEKPDWREVRQAKQDAERAMKANRKRLEEQ